MPPPAALAKMGRYQIIKHLARGGMADLLLARTSGIEGFSRHVVLKCIRPEQARDQLYVSMFLDEARLAASLHHHNIVQVTDIGESHGDYFFTMEYVHGEDARMLLSRVSRRRELVPLEHVLSIVCSAAAGLHYAHEQRGADRTLLGIVHRDVSPANILIGYDGSVKVADFGIAKAKHRRAETETGTLKGKVAYMSPEQAVGEVVDRRSDVFALGIVMYELLTVRRLFKGENDFLTMTAIVLGYVPPASQLRPDLPPEIEDILMKALAAKPEDRFASADELRLALEHAAARLQLPMSSTGLADYMKRVFGERPLPWMDDREVPFDDEIDFDGSRSGIARAPTYSPPEQTDATDLPELAAELVVVSFDDLGSSPSIVELTVPKRRAVPPQPAVAVRVETEIPPLHVLRTLAAFVALVAIGISIYLVLRLEPDEDLRVVVPVPVPVQVIDAPPAPPVAQPELPREPPKEPPKVKKAKSKRPVISKPQPPKRRDLDSLFPE